jgi:hypothetical protein
LNRGKNKEITKAPIAFMIVVSAENEDVHTTERVCPAVHFLRNIEMLPKKKT